MFWILEKEDKKREICTPGVCGTSHLAPRCSCAKQVQTNRVAPSKEMMSILFELAWCQLSYHDFLMVFLCLDKLSRHFYYSGGTVISRRGLEHFFFIKPRSLKI